MLNQSRNNVGCAALQCLVCLCVDKQDSMQLIANWCKMNIFPMETVAELCGLDLRLGPVIGTYSCDLWLGSGAWT